MRGLPQSIRVSGRAKRVEWRDPSSVSFADTFSRKGRRIANDGSKYLIELAFWRCLPTLAFWGGTGRPRDAKRAPEDRLRGQGGEVRGSARAFVDPARVPHPDAFGVCPSPEG